MRYAIVTNKMIVGGVERALINLLKSNKFNNHEVDLYLLDIDGEWMGKLPDYINVKKICIKKPMIDFIHILESSKNLYNYLRMRISKVYSKECFYNSKLFEIPKEKYDVAISYHSPGGISVFYTLFNLDAKVKELYIHGDVKKCKCDTSFMQKNYIKYDKIKCVSLDAYNVFIDSFSTLKEKTTIEYNIIDVDEILSLSNENCELIDLSVFSILTIARLSKEKGIDLAIDTMRLLKKHNLNIKWYVCGDGAEKRMLEEKIKEYNLQENFILLGNCDNPYKYIKKCNLYVQPSRHEGYCLTLAEALLIKNYAICTEFAGAFEQIQNGINGNIVKFDCVKLYEQIREYIDSNLIIPK